MMTIDQAEALLSELRTRENAKLAGMVREWDQAYAVAYGAYRAERNFRVSR